MDPLSWHHYLTAGIVVAAGMVGCAADSPHVEAPAPASVPVQAALRIQTSNASYAPRVTTIELPGGGCIVITGMYDNPKDNQVIVMDAPGSTIRLLYPLPAPPPVPAQIIAPTAAPWWYGEIRKGVQPPAPLTK